MKTIIAGSRGIHNFDFLCNSIAETGIGITEIISGTAAGVDRMGEKYAQIHNIPVKKFPAEWTKYGKRAGYLRNEDMAKYADVLIALWDGESKGTAHMIQISKNEGLQVFVFKYDGKSN